MDLINIVVSGVRDRCVDSRTPCVHLRIEKRRRRKSIKNE